MKRKNMIITALLIALSLTLTACSKGAEPTSSPSVPESGAADAHKVTLYDDAVLAELEAANGAVLTLGADGKTINGFTPEKAGFEFLGWFSTPNKSRSFDFDTVIKGDLSLYAGFAAHQDDTRAFFIVGAGKSSIMLASNWGGGDTAFDEMHQLTKAAGANEFSITADLVEGDEFQFVINDSWQNQRGFGYLAEDKLADGTVVFSGAGGLGNVSPKTSNIRVELSGNYTLTLTTYPAEDYYDTANSEYSEDNKESYNMGTYDRIEWVRNGDVEDTPDIELSFYIKGAGITQWENVYAGSHKLAAADGASTLEIFLKEGEEFLFISTITQDGITNEGTEFLRFENLDADSKALFDEAGGMGANMIAKADGTYHFTYYEDSNVLSVSKTDDVPAKRDYYLDGTFLGEWGDPMYGSADDRIEGEQGAGSNLFIDTYQLVETSADAGFFKLSGISFAAGDEVVVQTYKRGATENGLWGTDGNNLLGTYGYHSLLKGKADFDSEWDFNLKIRTDGTYDVTFDSYSMTILLERVN